jgi:hypothetical protein
MSRTPAWSGRRRQQFARQVRRRHGSTCWLCDKPIDPNLKHPHPKSFSVDHVEQRHHGGAVWDIENCRPAHLVCNLERPRNRTADDPGDIDPNASPKFWPDGTPNRLNTSRQW